MVKTLVQPFQ